MPTDDAPSAAYLLPVLVDLQHNGALGRPYNTLHEDGLGALKATARHLRRHGVGRCLATLTTYDYPNLIGTARQLGRWLDEDQDLARLFFGIFHEGVFISPVDGWRGAHAAKWVKPPDYALFRALDEASGRRVRMVNVAPEQPGGLDFVAQAASDGKVVAMGHSGAPAEVVRQAVARGASMVTHFGNGAPSLIHRFNNPLWAFLSEETLRLGLICDGFHLPGDLVRAAVSCKGRAKCIPVSDASADSARPPGRYVKFSGHPIVIEENRKLHLENSEILSGAWYQLDRAVQFLVEELRMPFLEAWAQCSTVPASFIGERLPQIAEGEEASFVLARWREGLVIEQSVQNGQACLDSPVRPQDV